MVIGYCRVRLYLPENHSLKGKRQALKSIIDRVRGRYNVAIAEVDDHDLWQSATLGISCVSSEERHANEVLSRVIETIRLARAEAELLDYEFEFIHA